MIAPPVNGSPNTTAPVARGGDDFMVASVQVEVAPSHSHVSRRKADFVCPPLNPPNITNFWVAWSKPIAAPVRAGGATLVCCCDHVVPSNVQVSFRKVLPT